jgi:hypothetical protein
MSSPTPNGKDDPPTKRQKVAMFDSTPGCQTTVSAAMNRLIKLVERHPQFYSKLEEMLEDVYDELEPEVSAVVRKEKNEESCPLYKLSNDEFKHIFGYVGEGQYRFVACTSYRFHQVHLESFGNETSMKRRGVCVLRSIVPWLGNASVL